MLAAVVFTMAYGALDEVHQIFVPNRSPDIYDAIADALAPCCFSAGTIFIQGRTGERLFAFDSSFVSPYIRFR